MKKSFNVFEILISIWNQLPTELRWKILWIFNKKLIVGVNALVVNEKKQILLLKHRLWINKAWGLPGGYVKSGETFENALRREVKEETNYEIDIKKLLQINSGHKYRTEISYLAEFLGGEEKIDRNEIIKAEFFSADRLPPGLLTSHKKLIEQNQHTGDKV